VPKPIISKYISREKKTHSGNRFAFFGFQPVSPRWVPAENCGAPGRLGPQFFGINKPDGGFWWNLVDMGFGAFLMDFG